MGRISISFGAWRSALNSDFNTFELCDLGHTTANKPQLCAVSLSVPMYSVASVVSDSLWPYGLSGSSVHEILQARILEWVALPSSRRSSQPRNWTHITFGYCIAGEFFTAEPLRKPCLICNMVEISIPWGRLWSSDQVLCVRVPCKLQGLCAFWQPTWSALLARPVYVREALLWVLDWPGCAAPPVQLLPSCHLLLLQREARFPPGKPSNHLRFCSTSF